MKVIVENFGEFDVPFERVQELLQWLRNNSVKTEQNPTKFDGNQLINE